MSRVDLPDGGWCELRTPAQVPERLRRPAKTLFIEIGRLSGAVEAVEANDVSGLSPEAVELFDKLNDVVAVAYLSAWSFEAPISVESLGDLPGAVYDAVRDAVAPLALGLFPNFTPDGVADPKALTAS